MKEAEPITDTDIIQARADLAAMFPARGKMTTAEILQATIDDVGAVEMLNTLMRIPGVMGGIWITHQFSGFEPALGGIAYGQYRGGRIRLRVSAVIPGRILFCYNLTRQNQ